MKHSYINCKLQK